MASIETIFSFLNTTGPSLLLYLLPLPLIAFAISWVHGVYDGRHAPWRYVYGLVVHIATAALLAPVALAALYVLEGGAVSDRIVPHAAAGYLLGSWILSLLVVKRAVDFRHIPAVRNPLLVALGWVFAWVVGGALYLSGLWLIPGPPLNTAFAVALLVFGVFELFLMIPGSRT